MGNLMGSLDVRVLRGHNLAVRDFYSSDPYVIITLGDQIEKTKVIKSNLEPSWDETFSMAVPEHCPPLKLQVMDRDRFSRDDSMGNAEVSLKYLIDAVKSNQGKIPNKQREEIGRIHASPENGLIKDSVLLLTKRSVIQTLHLRLKDVECGELEIELHWVHS